jgi:Tol biopolymer transport system component
MVRNKVNHPHRGWVGFWALVLILAITACSRDDPPAEPTSSPLPPTPTTSPSATPPPARQTPRPTATQRPPTATPAPPPTFTPSPTATTAPTATATPTPALRRLTTGGCCTQPFWSPDSQQVLFIDQPSPDAPLGIWGVALAPPGATPQLRTGRIAFYSADLSYVVTYNQGETVIERLDGPLSETVVQRWTVPSGGRSISLSPGLMRIAWQVSNDDAPSERRVSEVWVANFDGTEARAVATLPRGGLSGWVSDDVLLLTGRESLDSEVTVVYTLALSDEAHDTTVELVRAGRPRSYTLSPDRRWLVYYITFADDPAENGLWLVRTDGTEQRQLAPELFGAYQWRDAHRLVIIPYRPEAVYHELWEYDVETGQVRHLTDPGVTPFKVANGDWHVSPDGSHVAFVEDDDRNIWVLTLVE